MPDSVAQCYEPASGDADHCAVYIHAKGYPMRVATLHKGIKGELCTDQLKAISTGRIIPREGTLAPPLRPMVNQVLQQMFSEP